MRSTDFDPDVFVWDTQERAIAYAARVEFPKVDDVLRHIILAKAGTHAVVVGCSAGSVHQRFASDAEEVVLVRIASGLDRGKLGWVTSSDLRV